MRGATGLSQRIFTKLVGLSVETPQNREPVGASRRGPAAVLLTVLVADPDAVLRAVR